MIAGIGDVYAIGSVRAYALGAIEFTGSKAGSAPGREDFLAEGGELLDAIHKRVFADNQVTLCIDGHGARQRQFPGVRASGSPSRGQPALGREMIHALVVRFDDDNIARGVPAHALWFAEISLWHLPRKKESPIRTELLHAARHVHNKQVIVAVQRQRARLIELPGAGAPHADDFNGGKDGAVAQAGLRFMAQRRRTPGQEDQNESQARTTDGRALLSTIGQCQRISAEDIG